MIHMIQVPCLSKLQIPTVGIWTPAAKYFHFSQTMMLLDRALDQQWLWQINKHIVPCLLWWYWFLIQRNSHGGNFFVGNPKMSHPVQMFIFIPIFCGRDFLLCSVNIISFFRWAASIQNSHGGNSGSSTLSLAGLMDRSGDSFLKASPQSLYIELSIVILDYPMCYLFRWRDASLPSGFPQWEFGVMWLMSLEV